MICRQLIARWTWPVQHCPYARLTVTWETNDTVKAGVSRHLNTRHCVFIFELFFLWCCGRDPDAWQGRCRLWRRPSQVIAFLFLGCAQLLPTIALVQRHNTRLAKSTHRYTGGEEEDCRGCALLSMILPFFFMFMISYRFITS